MSGPLAGIRILDVTSVVMGPYATSILADLGAEVIKIEHPDGDVGRQLGPTRHECMSALALNLQRNKRSITIDTRSETGLAELRGLVRGADAIVTNLRPSSRIRLGLDSTAVHEINSNAVVCTAHGFSSTSQWYDEPAYDDIIQAASGMCDTYRRVYGEPRYSPSIVADKVCGMSAVNVLLAALLHREKTGEGQWVDVPMVDTMTAFNLVEHLAGQTFVPPEGKAGWNRTMSAERHPHAAKDGWICVMPYSNRDWRNFFTAVGKKEILDDERFATNAARNENSGPLQALLGDIIATRTMDEWLALCGDYGIAAQKVLDLDHIEDSDYLSYRRILSEDDHPTEGRYLTVRFPAEFSATPVESPRPAPHPGEHNGYGWSPRDRTAGTAIAGETSKSASSSATSG